MYVVHAAGSEGSTAGSCNAKHHTRLNTLIVVGCNLHYWLSVLVKVSKACFLIHKGWIQWKEIQPQIHIKQVLNIFTNKENI